MIRMGGVNVTVMMGGDDRLSGRRRLPGNILMAKARRMVEKSSNLD